MEDYKIYYIGKNKINWEKSNTIGYTFETLTYEPIENLIESLKPIFDQASSNPKTNYLIYLEELTVQHCIELSKLISYLSESGKIFMNITIYNKTINAHLSIIRVNGFKKIVNIFPFDRAIKVCDQNVFESVIFINKTITVQFDPTKLENCFTIWYENKTKQSGGVNVFSPDVIKLYDFRMMDTNDSTELESTWWFKYYFSIPPCAYGRLAQSSGTCWLNVCLNILFLSEPIADLIVLNYHRLSKELKEQIVQIKKPGDIFTTNYPLAISLWSLVNIFLINKSKATTLDNNFILVLGAKIKSACEFGNENYYIENNLGIEYGNAYYTYKAFIYLCEFYLNLQIDFFPLFSYTGIQYSIIKKLDNLYDRYDSLKPNLNDSNLDEFNQIEKEIDMYSNANLKSFKIVENIGTSDRQVVLPWDDILFGLPKVSSSDPPKLFIIPDFPDLRNKQIQQVIYLGDTEYKLIAGGIQFIVKELNISHIVSGLICGSKYYIYDSNNIISYNNWNQGTYNDYIEQLNTFYKVNAYSYDYSNTFSVYIKT